MNAEFSQLFPSDFPDKVKDLLNSKYPLPPNSGRFTYGTAGFRTKGIILPPVAARVIFIAMLRSWYHRGNSQRGSSGSSIGLMITASHNPPADNGFKIIDVDGGMLTTSWEKWCTKAANTKSGDDFLCVIHECIIAEKIAVPQAKEKTPFTILLGRDTRDSGDSILKAITDVLDTVFINDGYRDFGIVATPQLHFLVARMNSLPCDKCDSLDEGSYFEELLNSFANLMEVANCRSPRQIVVDAANGVGALTLRRLIEYSEKHSNTLSKYLNFTVVNDNTDCSDKLNLECGADYAKQYSIPSSSMKRWEDSPQKNSDIHFYCLDGDADRLVAFDLDTRNDEKWRLIDGDRLLALYTRLLIHLLGEPALLAANFGVVQTAYANGASTEFLRDFLNVKTYITATGVKNLHHVASSCGIGAYFEANGHGTVLFNRESCDKAIAFYCSNLPEIDREKEKCRLSLIFDNLPRLFSQTCGDAIADLLACEFALSFTSLPYRMVHPMFSDRPFILSKVHVDNPMITTRADDETKVVTPCGMQSTIDAAVQRTIDSLRQAGHQGRGLYARCFVRQSGTEPVVRVYAEASTKEACSILSSEVERIVSEACSSHDTA